MKYQLLLLVFSMAFLTSSCGNSEASNDANDQYADSTNVEIDSNVVETGKPRTFEDFVDYSESLESSIISLDSLHRFYDLNKANFTQDEIDSSYFIYVLMMHKIEGAFEGIELPDAKEEKELKDKYGPYGFRLQSGEGYVWLHVDESIPLERFEGDVSKDVIEYAKLGEITGKQYSADAGMLISYEEWGKVVTDLEDRLRKNRDSKYYDEFLSTYIAFLTNYMYGMDNTPTIASWEDPRYLEEEVRLAYEKMIADEQHKTGKIIEEHMRNLEANNYDVGWENRWMPSKQEIEEYLELK